MFLERQARTASDLSLLTEEEIKAVLPVVVPQRKLLNHLQKGANDLPKGPTLPECKRDSGSAAI